MSRQDPATANQGPFAVFVRFPDQNTAQRVTPDGRATRRRVHPAQFTTRDQAERVAAQCRAYLDTHHPGSPVRVGRF
jgi:hypothetical protein